MIKTALAVLTSLTMSIGLYPGTYKITNLDYSNDIVTMTDSEGFSYDFYGCEDYNEGDLVSAIMWDNGTELIYDDAVIMVQYAGSFKGV